MDPIRSERLELVSMSPDFIEALLDEPRPEAEAIGGFKLPDGWPDAHDRGFVALRLRQMRERPEIQEWFVYAIVLPDGDRPMIGHAGFHGPPGVNAIKDADAVEVGYMILEPYRRRGYATEVVASLALVRRLGFREFGRHWDEEDGEELEFELQISGGA